MNLEIDTRERRSERREPVGRECEPERRDLTREQREVVAELCQYRVARVIDLRKWIYRGNADLCRADMARLAQLKLIHHVKAVVGWRRSGEPVMCSYAAAPPTGKPQRVRDVIHDARVYGAVVAMRDEIERAGGKVRGVILEREMMARVAKARGDSQHRGEAAMRGAARAAAAEYGLRQVDGRIPLPDAQIVYEDSRGGVHRCSIEVTTVNYSSGAKSAKRAAGFHLTAGAEHSSAARGSGMAHHKVLEL